MSSPPFNLLPVLAEFRRLQSYDPRSSCSARSAVEYPTTSLQHSAETGRPLLINRKNRNCTPSSPIWMSWCSWFPQASPGGSSRGQHYGNWEPNRLWPTSSRLPIAIKFCRPFRNTRLRSTWISNYQRYKPSSNLWLWEAAWL